VWRDLCLYGLLCCWFKGYDELKMTEKLFVIVEGVCGVEPGGGRISYFSFACQNSVSSSQSGNRTRFRGEGSAGLSVLEREAIHKSEIEMTEDIPLSDYISYFRFPRP